jgi:hypothetical protein
MMSGEQEGAKSLGDLQGNYSVCKEIPD